jgi:hypothetical protein
MIHLLCNESRSLNESHIYSKTQRKSGKNHEYEFCLVVHNFPEWIAYRDAHHEVDFVDDNPEPESKSDAESEPDAPH